MKTWQRYWLYSVIAFFSLHLIRDILQDLRLNTLLSDTLVKSDVSETPVWYWTVFNTYLIEITELLLAGFSLKRGKFGSPGYLTIFIALGFLAVWLFYWFFL